MKKLISVLLIVTLLVLSLVSCGDAVDNSKDSNDESSVQSQVDLGVGEPYELEFKSNGDGTCALTAIKYNRKYTAGFTVDIPEKSPAGDTVTSIDITYRTLAPEFISDEDMKGILDKIESDNEKSRDLRSFPAFYILKDPYDEALSEKTKENIIKEFPMSEFIAMYIREPCISQQELQHLDAILIATGYDSSIVAKCADALYEATKDNLPDMDQWYEQQTAGLEFCGDYVVEITLPATIETISAESVDNFASCPRLEKVSGIDDSIKVFGDKGEDISISDYFSLLLKDYNGGEANYSTSSDLYAGLYKKMGYVLNN